MVTHTIELIRGDSFALTVRWLDADRDPIEISSARLQVRTKPDSRTALLTLTDGAGLELSAPGTIDVTITSEQSQELSSGAWDLEATSVGDQVKTLVGGKFLVEKDVSHG